MNTKTGIRLPPSLLKNIKEAPSDLPVVLLLRHAARGEIPPGTSGNDLPITEDGHDLARALGALFGDRLMSLHTSPVLRCVQTAKALLEGANRHFDVVENRLLGDPGVFVLDGDLAWKNWQLMGHEGVIRHLVSEAYALPGMAQPDAAAWQLVNFMLGAASESGLHVFVTHDILVTATLARLQRKIHGPSDWPHFLEGALFWQNHRSLHIAYRNMLNDVSIV
ncbi:MAG: histidine phosphatase family protein [Planctomycetales bacterium]|nr:histidine phosphatase family protein [Planctomycetales bacterium]